MLYICDPTTDVPGLDERRSAWCIILSLKFICSPSVSSYMAFIAHLKESLCPVVGLNGGAHSIIGFEQVRRKEELFVAYDDCKYMGFERGNMYM